MAVEEKIKQILRGLEALYPRILILVGGSRWRGNYTDRSDLDIYIVGGSLQIYKILRHKTRLLDFKKNWPGLTINIMLVPKFLAKRGWYYVEGVNADDKIFKSFDNPRIILGNSLKLSGWYFLKSADAIALEKKQYWLKKGWQQLGYLKSTPNQNLGWRDNWQKIYFERERELKFSWSNWLIYNIKFIREGWWWWWLAKNPDRFVLKQIAKIIERGGYQQYGTSLFGNCGISGNFCVNFTS